MAKYEHQLRKPLQYAYTTRHIIFCHCFHLSEDMEFGVLDTYKLYTCARNMYYSINIYSFIRNQIHVFFAENYSPIQHYYENNGIRDLFMH